MAHVGVRPEEEPLFVARGLTVYRRPVRTRIASGVSIALGFPVCTASEYIGEEGAVAIAAALNHAEAAPTAGSASDQGTMEDAATGEGT